MRRFTGTSRMYRLLRAEEHFRDKMENYLEWRDMGRQGIAVHNDEYALLWQAASKAYHKCRRQLLDMAMPIEAWSELFAKYPLEKYPVVLRDE
jgi:hypothetical protein